MSTGSMIVPGPSFSNIFKDITLKKLVYFNGPKTESRIVHCYQMQHSGPNGSTILHECQKFYQIGSSSYLGITYSQIEILLPIRGVERKLLKSYEIIKSMSQTKNSIKLDQVHTQASHRQKYHCQLYYMWPSFSVKIWNPKSTPRHQKQPSIL